MEYKPLNKEKHEIRVLSISPPTLTPTGNPGRTFNSWSPSAIQCLDWGASGLRLNPTDDPVHCTLEHVSLQDMKDEYRAYQSLSANTRTKISWENYVLAVRSRVIAGKSDVIQLLGWRGPGEYSGDPFDRVASLDTPILLVPRYNWGDFETLSYTWSSDTSWRGRRQWKGH
jgi:hypothetical protein